MPENESTQFHVRLTYDHADVDIPARGFVTDLLTSFRSLLSCLAASTT